MSPSSSVEISRDLVEACWGKDWEKAAYILGGDDYDVLWADAESFTALHWAANHGEPVLTTALLELGANPAAVNRFGNTPLMLACSGKLDAENGVGLLRVIQLLIAFGSPLPMTRRDGALPEKAREYDDAVVTLLHEAKGLTLEQRAATRAHIDCGAEFEGMVKVVVSGQVRRHVDETAKQKRDAIAAYAAAREERRLAEVKAHTERLAKIGAKAARAKAQAESEARAAEAAAMRSELIRWAAPLPVLASLVYLHTTFVESTVSTTMAVAGVFACACWWLHVWISAPLRRPALPLGQKKR